MFRIYKNVVKCTLEHTLPHEGSFPKPHPSSENCLLQV